MASFCIVVYLKSTNCEYILDFFYHKRNFSKFYKLLYCFGNTTKIHTVLFLVPRVTILKKKIVEIERFFYYTQIVNIFDDFFEFYCTLWKLIKIFWRKNCYFWNQNVHSVLFVHVYFKNVSYFCQFLKRNTNIVFSCNINLFYF